MGKAGDKIGRGRHECHGISNRNLKMSGDRCLSRSPFRWEFGIRLYTGPELAEEEIRGETYTRLPDVVTRLLDPWRRELEVRSPSMFHFLGIFHSLPRQGRGIL